MHSGGIESVVDQKDDISSGLHKPTCGPCEMAVIWMRNQLSQNKTLDHILNYANEVKLLSVARIPAFLFLLSHLNAWAM